MQGSFACIRSLGYLSRWVDNFSTPTLFPDPDLQYIARRVLGYGHYTRDTQNYPSL